MNATIESLSVLGFYVHRGLNYKLLRQRYNEEKADKKESLKRGNSPSGGHHHSGAKTSERIAKEEGVGEKKVREAAARMEIHDAVEAVAPEAAEAVMELPQKEPELASPTPKIAKNPVFSREPSSGSLGLSRKSSPGILSVSL